MEKTICDIGSRSNTSVCQYLKSECDQDFFLIARKIYCSQSTSPRTLLTFSSLGLIICVLVLVVSIGIISSTYLLHSVTNLTEMLHLRREMLSYVIIPLMNGAPDIVNSHLMIKSKSMSLVMGQIIGANLISFTVIVGSISIMSPFTVNKNRTLLIGYCFVCIMILILSYVLLDGQISFFECLILTSLYPIHIFLVSFDRSVERFTADLERSISKDIVTEASYLVENQGGNEEVPQTPPRDSSSHIFKRIVNVTSIIVDHVLFFLIPISRSSLSHPSMNASSFKFRTISNFWFQLWLVIVSVVLLNVSIFHLPLKILQYLIGISFCVSRLLTSILAPTVFDSLINVTCIMNSLTLMAIITKALILILKNLGVMWQISEYIMGLLVFSLVSCLNDILMNISLALNYSPSLGIKACMSSCCLLISIGVGFNGFWDLLMTGIKTGRLSSSLSLPVTLTWELYASLIALNLTVISAMTYMILNKWTLDRNLGLGLIGVWIAATTTCIVMEFN